MDYGRLTSRSAIQIKTMTRESLRRLAEEVGEVTEERDDEHDRKVSDFDISDFDYEQEQRDREEYNGGWDTDH